jgi:hypothetical protein
LVLKSNGALVSLQVATNATGEALKSNSSLQHNSDDNSAETTHGRIGSFSGLESQEEQEYIISITKCEATKHNHAKSSTPLRSYKDNKLHTANRRSTSQPPGPSSAMKRATSPKFRIPSSHSLASPFPMQFRVRATAPAASDTPLTRESNFTTNNALSVRTEFGIDEEIQDQPSTPPPPPSRFSPTISITSSIDSEVKSCHGTLDTLSSYSIQLTRTHSYPSNVLECYKTSPSPRKDRPPPCPGYSRRKLLSPAPPLESDPQSRRYGRRKTSVLNLEWHDKDMARSNSILDDYDDDENDESAFDDFSCQSALSEAGDVSPN